MPYVKIEDMDMVEQVDILIKAVRQLQARFENHEHGRTGGVMCSVMMDDSVDMNGKFDGDEC